MAGKKLPLEKSGLGNRFFYFLCHSDKRQAIYLTTLAIIFFTEKMTNLIRYKNCITTKASLKLAIYQKVLIN
ncbi:MAG TPA: hypothetical protein PK110_08395 [Niabella sp.]|nr:hypothetical protein [Chitinophagaceae bacterium]HRN49285.1 hypothetical protein [Niabella sp.]HRO84824.1 hypothetical protein [Niabella sp.]HUN02933.1 hypothetical protein [Niabella sp.]